MLNIESSLFGVTRWYNYSFYYFFLFLGGAGWDWPWACCQLCTFFYPVFIRDLMEFYPGFIRAAELENLAGLVWGAAAVSRGPGSAIDRVGCSGLNGPGRLTERIL